MTDQIESLTRLRFHPDQLDPIRVYIETYPNNAHMMTIVCCGQAWSHAWSAIGPGSLFDFFIDANNSYIVEKFFGDTKETDYDQIGNDTGIDGIDVTSMLLHSDILCDTYGEDWCLDIPRCTSSDAKYFYRIIYAVKNHMIQIQERAYASITGGTSL